MVQGGGGYNKDPLVPPPLHPLPPGEGRFLGCIEKMLEENSHIFSVRIYQYILDSSTIEFNMPLKLNFKVRVL